MNYLWEKMHRDGSNNMHSTFFSWKTICLALFPRSLYIISTPNTRRSPPDSLSIARCSRPEALAALRQGRWATGHSVFVVHTRAWVLRGETKRDG